MYKRYWSVRQLERQINSFYYERLISTSDKYKKDVKDEINILEKKDKRYLEKDFKSVISEIKSDIKNTQLKTILQTNSNLIMLYYRTGKIMFENSKYGTSFIKNVATEIKIEFPNIEGFSERNLRSMKLFYLEYKNDEIWQQIVAKLPWGHNLLLIQKIKDQKIRKIYAEETIKNGWSRSVLQFQIETDYHKRVGNSTNNFNATLPPIDSDLVNDTIKDPYIFDFIALKSEYKEKDLENSMIKRIRDVLLELGNGFTFVGNQYKITVGNEDYFLDLLFYHLKLRCYIVVELKTKKFIPEYVGKMNFYLSAVDDILKGKNDNPSVGLILCKEKNKFTAQYSLKDINKPIGISSFKVNDLIPQEILNELPTEEEINLHININNNAI